jgi:hypothetical protein
MLQSHRLGDNHALILQMIKLYLRRNMIYSSSINIQDDDAFLAFENLMLQQQP